MPFLIDLALIRGASCLRGEDAIAVSHLAGSNIFNVLVLLGMSALLVPLRMRSRLVHRDVPLLLGVSMATRGMASGGRLSWQATSQPGGRGSV
jgi:cation:H+ antiporter